jgi:hypothetical protein
MNRTLQRRPPYHNDVPKPGGDLDNIAGSPIKDIGHLGAGQLQSADAGARMFWDLISLFYDVSAPKDVPINVTQQPSGRLRDSVPTASTTWQRPAVKTLSANYDLSQIAEWCASRAAWQRHHRDQRAPPAGTEVTVTRQVLQPAEYPTSTSQVRCRLG